MANKTLDLDDLLGRGRTVRLGGVEYPVHELRLKDVLETQRIAEQIAAGGDEVSVFDAMLRVVQIYLPSAPADQLRDLPLVSLEALQRFLASRGGNEDSGGAPPTTGTS